MSIPLEPCPLSCEDELRSGRGVSHESRQLHGGMWGGGTRGLLWELRGDTSSGAPAAAWHLSGDSLPEGGSPGASRAERESGSPGPAALDVLVPGPGSVWVCLDFPGSSLLWASTSVLSTCLPPLVSLLISQPLLTGGGAAHTTGVGGDRGSREDVIWPEHTGDPSPFC